MLFNTLEELQQFIPLENNFSLERITPDLRTAYRRQVLPYLSADLAAKLERAYQKANTISARFADLLPRVQEAIAHFAYAAHIPDMQARATDAGLHQTTDQNQTPLYRYQKDELIQKHSEAGFFALDELIVFLEDNERLYPEWANSNSCTLLRKNILQTGREFAQYVSAPSSRRLFYALKPFLSRAEQSFIPSTISPQLYESLMREIADNRISPRFVPLLDLLKPAIANLTLALASPELVIEWYGKTIVPPTIAGASRDSVKAEIQNSALQVWKNDKETTGKTLLQRAKKHLNAFAPLFPEYPINTEKINNKGTVFSF